MSDMLVESEIEERAIVYPFFLKAFKRAFGVLVLRCLVLFIANKSWIAVSEPIGLIV